MIWGDFGGNQVNKKIIARITIVSFIIGLMIAIQYNTVQKPTERDTRDIWEVRQELSEEKKRQSELLSEILTLSEDVKEYESSNSKNQGQVLQNTLEELKREAGLSPVSGPGLTLNIRPSMELIEFGYQVEPISPELLIRLVNEIFRFNGLYMEINGQRIVHTTAIRDINGDTTVNSIPINDTEVEIKVITESFEMAEKLYSYLYASGFQDDFYIDNLDLVINKAQDKITITKFDGELVNSYLVEENKGD